MKKNIILVITAFLIISNSLFSIEKSPIGIYSKIGANYNMIKSKGIEIPPFCPTCIEVDNGSGLAYGLGIGINYTPKTKLFGMNFQYGSYFAFYDLFSRIDKTTFLGNLINSNDIIKGEVQYKLNLFTKSLNFTPYIYLYPVDKLDLALKLGFNLSYIISSNNELSEKTVNPNTFFPNLKNENNYSSDKIKDLKAFYASIPIGLKYDLFKFKNLTISPEIQYNIAINNIQEVSNLKLNNLFAGVSMVYNFVKKIDKPIPPKPTSIPKPIPSEEKRPYIVSDLDWKINNIPVHNNDTLNIILHKRDYYHYLPLLEYLFFDFNSTELKFSDDEEIKVDVIDSPNAIQLKYFYYLAEIVKTQKVSEIEIYYTSDENSDIGEKRLQFIKNELISKNVDIRNIKFKVRKVNINKLKYPDLIEENRAVKLTIPGIDDYQLGFLNNSSIDYPLIKNELNIRMKSDSYIVGIKGDVFINDEPIYKIEAANNEYTLENSNFFDINDRLDNKILIKYDLENAANYAKSFTNALNLTFTIKDLDREVNVKNVIGDDSASYNFYFLSFFDFDKSKIKYINRFAKGKLEEAIKNNKKIEILGGNDGLGDEEYNNNLAFKRIKNTLKAMKINPNQLNIIDSPATFISNDTPIGRMYNRSVIIKIYN